MASSATACSPLSATGRGPSPLEGFHRRCRPALGTYVEVALAGLSPAASDRAIAAAFTAIRRTERRMSFHDPLSELSKLNRARVGRWVRVSRPLGTVLALAKALETESGGAFNVAIGRPLVAWNFLPGSARSPGWDALVSPAFEIAGSRARRLADAWIDLGGIAKGYAVDVAVDAILRCVPRAEGWVSAGGDLRVFGESPRDVWVRIGMGDRSRVSRIGARNAAVATSSVAPSADGAGRGLVSPYVDISRREPLSSARTAVARAPRCAVADGLTKIALLCPPSRARKIAARFGAELEALA